MLNRLPSEVLEKYMTVSNQYHYHIRKDHEVTKLLPIRDSFVYNYSKDSIFEILKHSILHWVCPVALEVQENGNAMMMEPLFDRDFDVWFFSKSFYTVKNSISFI